MNYPTPLKTFINTLTKNCPSAAVEVDAPRDPKGEWLLDISDGAFETSVAWRPVLGFGVFVSQERGLGDRPDELYKKADLAAKRVCGLIARYRGERSVGIMRLKELRHLVGAPQTQLAACLQIKQAAVSRFESRQDMHISSLAHYVQAIGGQLELRAKFADFEVRIDPLPEAGGDLAVRAKVGG